MENQKSREYYINLLRVGNIVAFKYDDNMFSGKVIEIADDIVVKTKNGSVYTIKKDSIVWVKNGTHWPVGIYNALKYLKKEE